MPILPLYPQPPRLRIEQLVPLDPDPGCALCKLHEGVRTPCMPAEGEPGGVLVVSDYPGSTEDRIGRPMCGPAGRFLRQELARSWRGPLAFENAVRCFAKGRKVEAKELRSCMGYLAGTLEEARPKRVLAMGGRAIASLAGHVVPPLSVRRGYTWLADTFTPVFLLPNPAAAVRNRFVKEWFCEDLRWALTTPLKKLRKSIEWLDASLTIVETVEEAEEGAEASREVGALAYDVEAAGRLWEDGNGYRHTDGFVEPAWRMLCASICPAGPPEIGSQVWLWDQATLAGRRPELLKPLQRVLQDRRVRKSGANEKYDRLAMHEIGIKVKGFWLDTRLARRILNPTADGTLAVMQHLVGMGGGKAEVKDAIAAITNKVRRSKKPIEGLPEDLVNALRRKVPKPAVNSATKDKWHCKKERYAYGLIDRDLLHRYNGIDTLSTARLAHLIDRRLGEGMPL